MEVQKIKVEICRGTSCHLMGSQELMEVVKSLPADRQEQIDLSIVDCLKSFRQGPNVRIDGKLFSGLTPEELAAMLQERECVAAD